MWSSSNNSWTILETELNTSALGSGSCDESSKHISLVSKQIHDNFPSKLNGKSFKSDLQAVLSLVFGAGMILLPTPKSSV